MVVDRGVNGGAIRYEATGNADEERHVPLPHVSEIAWIGRTVPAFARSPIG